VGLREVDGRQVHPATPSRRGAGGSAGRLAAALRDFARQELSRYSNASVAAVVDSVSDRLPVGVGYDLARYGAAFIERSALDSPDHPVRAFEAATGEPVRQSVGPGAAYTVVSANVAVVADPRQTPVRSVSQASPAYAQAQATVNAGIYAHELGHMLLDMLSAPSQTSPVDGSGSVSDDPWRRVENGGGSGFDPAFGADLRHAASTAARLGLSLPAGSYGWSAPHLSSDTSGHGNAEQRERQQAYELFAEVVSAYFLSASDAAGAAVLAPTMFEVVDSYVRSRGGESRWSNEQFRHEHGRLFEQYVQ